jgi:hypothetical protein
MCCRSKPPSRQRKEALSVGLLAMRVIDAFIAKYRGEAPRCSTEDAYRKLYGHEGRHYRNYCEAVIFEEISRELNRDRIIDLMKREPISKSECKEVINYWHELEKRALYYTDRTLGIPRGLTELLGKP